MGYYDWPKHEESYSFKGQYLFGPSLLVAPVATPAEADGYARKDIWLPPGQWVEWTHGRAATLKAGKDGLHLAAQKYSNVEIPIFARAGAVIPLRGELESSSWPDPLILDAVRGVEGTTVSSTVYDDA